MTMPEFVRAGVALFVILAKVPICKTRVPQDETHARAIRAAQAFFDHQLGVTR